MKHFSILILFFLGSINIYAQVTITLNNRKVIHAYIIDKSETELKYKLDTISGYTTFITKLSNVKSIDYTNRESALINTQDTIILKNRKVIHAYIIEKSDTKIKYRTDSINNVDSTYNMKLGRIRTIHYNNGEVDLLSSQNPRSVFPFGINVGFTSNFSSGLMFSGSIDYLITPNISTELNFKDIPFGNEPIIFSIGGKYWFANKYRENGFSPYVGLFLLRANRRNDYEDIHYYNAPEWSVFYLPEVPIGISYITKFGLQTSLQLSFPFVFPELRVGWRFK